MEASTEKTIHFRLEKSQEKLVQSDLMLQKGLYNDALLYSYLSMFYAIRVLLINHETDSDDEERIMKLAEQYFEPAGWESIDVIAVLKESKKFKDSIEKTPGIKIGREEADRLYRNAEQILAEVKRTVASPAR
ncbi:MAG TPA: HEPN domain-containing protein [Spirochaetota bacterium]|nr:HEPN domain-containing protein [Spirochaetota bacterium]HNT11055.1 HEPN domain-containing protein [Spirochaetota bacterium]HNV48422.1 HEPN domain-containing protein [Spirochaetota bacterium]HOS39394.1 HEPN domain-containing protein [Spirochaetota bacterium]HPU88552.1 HEPN domain-containing protein [Spirochaetota bacterium]